MMEVIAERISYLKDTKEDHQKKRKKIRDSIIYPPYLCYNIA